MVVEHWLSDSDWEVLGEKPVPMPLFLQTILTPALNGGKRSASSCGYIKTPEPAFCLHQSPASRRHEDVKANSGSTARRHALQDERQFHYPLVSTLGRIQIEQDEVEARKRNFQVSLANHAIHI